MTMLSVIQDAAVMCNLPPPTSAATSSDPNVPMLLRLANVEGRELGRRHDWTIMTFDFDFTSVDTDTLQVFMPTFYDRLVPYAVLWNRSLGQPYSGPTNIHKWNQLLGVNITAGYLGWWRFRSTFAASLPGSPFTLANIMIEITPVPTAGQTLAITMVSNGWCHSSNFDVQTAFLADTDEAYIPEHLITLGTVWRYKQAKGLDYAETMATYEREVERACSRDRAVGVMRPTSGTRVDDIPPASWTGVVIP